MLRDGNVIEQPEPVISAVCQVMAIHRRDLLGDYRYKFVVDARSVACMVFRNGGWSYPKIGKVLNRDHKTIHYLVNMFDVRAKYNPELQKAVEKIEGMI